MQTVSPMLISFSTKYTRLWPSNDWLGLNKSLGKIRFGLLFLSFKTRPVIQAQIVERI